MPLFFEENKIFEKEIKYKWNFKIAQNFPEPEFADAEYSLNKAVCGIGYKASIALVSAVSEWILWRLSKHIDTKKTSQLIEAWYAGSIDFSYMNLDQLFVENEQEDHFEGPIVVMIIIMDMIKSRYECKSYYIHEYILNIILLARYISPEKKIFDQWLSEKIQLISSKFPCRYNYNELDEDAEDEIYDDSQEETPPRDIFFEKLASLDSFPIKEKLNEFLSSIDYKTNPFLSSPEEMIAKGFKGKPYRFK